MNTFRVLPIPAALAQEVRATGRSPQYGHPTHTEIATGRGPCRSCLRAFRVGEESVRYIHVRSTEAGCYIASVERAHA